MDTAVETAELDIRSNFSFLEGASHAEELIAQAAALGYRAVGLADVGTMAGMVRAHEAARDHGIQLIVGARLMLAIEAGDDPANDLEVLAFAPDLASYGRLCRIITEGRAREDFGSNEEDEDGERTGHALDRGTWFLTLHQFIERAADSALQVIVVPPRGTGIMRQRFHEALAGMRHRLCNDALSLGIRRLLEPDDDVRLMQSRHLSSTLRIPLVALGDVHYHTPSRRRLQDVLAAIRLRCTVAQAGRRLFQNGERVLVPPSRQRERFLECPEAVARAQEIARRCSGFSLSQVKYRYPREVVPDGATPQAWLEQLTWEGARERYPHDRCPGGIPEQVRAQVEHEFAIIRDLDYARYFLTVHDIVREARSRGILCQGRGAAANSAVCYCLGVTSVDPARIDVLFERFVSRERDEPPDIDIDFEHERREEVIQYLYSKYGRDRAALCAEVVCYRGRMAVREVGKALGLSLDCVEQLASGVEWWHDFRGGGGGSTDSGGGADRGNDAAGPDRGTTEDTIDGADGRVDNRGAATLSQRLASVGLDPADPTVSDLATLVPEIIGFPRHLSQHVGGFIITDGPLCELVPIREASMDGRTIIEWDKDDIEAMGMLKVDCLALGMLTAIRKAMDLSNEFDRRHAHPTHHLQLHTIPAEDPATYDMVCAADTVGVFQIESRAQMSMLPRLRPRCFYDLVIEVAIVRPGPIQGDMVHPYLRRRRGEEPIQYPDDGVRRVLQKTLGVPLFQEQAMSLAVVAAGFTPGEADQLRRAIASWKRREGLIETFGRKIVGGMVERGYERHFAEQVFGQIRGFSGYGFPESHAASFALLVYASAWLKRHRPAAFCVALLNSQPMGFYAPAQLVRDAKDHGVDVRPVCVARSVWDCSLEGDASPAGPCGTAHAAIRLGMRMVRGMREDEAIAISRAWHAHGPFQSMEALWHAARVPVASLRQLARADAFMAMGIDRQQALWQLRALTDDPAPVFDSVRDESPTLWDHAVPDAPLPTVSPMVRVGDDLGSVGLSLRAHPISFLRAGLLRSGVARCSDLRDEGAIPDRSRAAVAGLVLVRQRPSTAKGIVFMTIEDESGPANLILRPRIYEAHRAAARHGRVVLAQGTVERRDGVVNLLVRRIRSIDGDVAAMLHRNQSRDFH